MAPPRQLPADPQLRELSTLSDVAEMDWQYELSQRSELLRLVPVTLRGCAVPSDVRVRLLLATMRRLAEQAYTEFAKEHRDQEKWVVASKVLACTAEVGLAITEKPSEYATSRNEGRAHRRRSSSREARLELAGAWHYASVGAHTFRDKPNRPRYETESLTAFRDGLAELLRDELLVAQLAADLGYTPSEDETVSPSLIEERSADAPVAGESQWPDTGAVERHVPRELLHDIPDFVARGDQLTTLDRLFTQWQAGATAPTITALTGTAGVGKTALAMRWAHRVRDQFPDGDIYVNLRGYSTSEPMTTGEALVFLLRKLGIDDTSIPQDVYERATFYRSLLNDRRILLVFDNALNADQVRPLLPGGASCFVLITSRDDFRGLVAFDSAEPVHIGLLESDEAATLLQSMIGTERVQQESAAAEDLITLSAHLPLAVRVIAALAKIRKDKSLASLVDELRDEQRKINLLSPADDPTVAVRTCFSLSYKHLDAPIARTFRLLGLHLGHAIDVYAVAALTGSSRTTAQTHLDRLLSGNLFDEVATGYFATHDLLMAYARECANEVDRTDIRRDALARLCGYYRFVAAECVNFYASSDRHRRPEIAVYDGDRPPIADTKAALQWLNTEIDGVLTLAAYAPTIGPPEVTVQLSAILYRYLDFTARYLQGYALHKLASEVAAAIEDKPGEASALNAFGVACLRLGMYAEAEVSLTKSAALYGELDDLDGESRASGNLGMIFIKVGRRADAIGAQEAVLALQQQLGSYDGQHRAYLNLGYVALTGGRHLEALRYFTKGMELSRKDEDIAGEARGLGNLSPIYERLEQYDKALECAQSALEKHISIDDQHGISNAQGNIAVIYTRLGHFDEALAILQDCLKSQQEAGDRPMEAYTHNNIGTALRHLGKMDEAISHYEAALVMAAQMGQPEMEAEFHNDYGDSLRTWERREDALDHYQAARQLSREIDDVYHQARALDGMAEIAYANGDLAAARSHRKEALPLYIESGVPQAHRIRTQLACLDEG